MKQKKNPVIARVHIDSFTKKGHGLGFSEESAKKIQVPFCIPGDIADVTLGTKRSQIYSSRLHELVTASPKRIEPKCVHFATCGGCRWQQMSYDEQLAIKQQQIEELFNPFLQNSQKVLPVVPSDPPWQYRNKMEFSFSNDLEGHQFLGLMIDSSRGKVLNLTECHLVSPWFVETLKAVRAWWKETELKAYHPYSDRGALRTLIVREGQRTGDRLVMLTVSGNPEYALKRHEIESFVAFVKDAVEPVSGSGQLSIFLRIQQIARGVETQFFEMLLSGKDHIREQLNIQIESGQPEKTIEFKVSPSAFFQPNTRQAEKLYSIALQHLNILKDSVVYDLYCGTGTLGICASQVAKKVIGIELSPESSLDAKENVKENRLDNVEILTGDVRRVVRDLLLQKDPPIPDVVMLDPPRSGLDPATIDHLLKIKPKKILYISCNPLTQVENVRELLKGGYEILVIQPVDQFPQTPHIENIVVLEIKPVIAT